METVTPERLEELKDAFEERTNGDIALVSAVTGENMRPLLYRIEAAIEGKRAADKAEAERLARGDEDDSWTP